MNEHMQALYAVSRDKTGVPNCSDRQLHEAERAGLIKFSGWPSGHWNLTNEGRAALYEGDAQ